MPPSPSTAELPIQEAALDLVRWFIPVLHRLPRLHRHGLGDRLITNLYDVVEQLVGFFRLFAPLPYAEGLP